MKCPKCNSVLSLKSNRCERCGEDIQIYKKVVKASNAYYNQGLMRAKVRDLSGAVTSLKKSLELDKRNTNARNLLGLVYLEMGETVSALSEWVISKHFDDGNDNIATEYMNAIQSNPTKLESINQAIKKYNSALISAQQGSGDLAIIQLKKVVNLNPRFIRAYQLLALLYIQSGEKEKAERMLRKAVRIDVNNTVTLRYMKELGVDRAKAIAVAEAGKDEKSKDEKRKEIMANRGTEYNSFTGMKEFKEEKHNVLAYVNLVIGVVLGILAAWVLILPQIQNSEADKLNQQIKKYQEQVSNYESTSNSTDGKIKDLEEQVKDLTSQLEEAKNAAVETKDTSSYDALLTAMNYYVDNKTTEAAEALINVDEAKLTSEEAKTLYATIKEATVPKAVQSLYQTGYTQYNNNKFEESLATLQKVVALQPDHVNAIYFIARSYDKLGDTEQARELYTKIIEEYPNTDRATKAQTKLDQLS